MEDGELGDTSGTCSTRSAKPSVSRVRSDPAGVKHTRAQQSSQVGLLLSAGGRSGGRHFDYGGVSGRIELARGRLRGRVCRKKYGKIASTRVEQGNF